MSLITANFCPVCIERIKGKQEQIHSWLSRYETAHELPLYSSVDIRDAGFKVAVVDTNLFPAGFNNICEHGLADSVGFFKDAIQKRVPQGRDILIIAEEHTRNTWYLENVRILQDIIAKAGFNVKVATFLSVQPEFCQDVHFVELITATNQALRIHCFRRILEDVKAGKTNFDLIIMNNDLSTGIPDILKDSRVPIYPSLQAGWHARLKSHHFTHASELIGEFARIVGLDPWLFSCLCAVSDNIDINDENDRKQLAGTAEDLFAQITKKYKEHGIQEKPYVVVKADAGTYGMGVMTIEDPQDIRTLNHRARTKMAKGKSAKVITRYLLQEGVPTIRRVEQQVSEVVIYQIEQNLVGGFYRTHATKSDRENLNTQGMEFKKMCPHLKKYGDCGIHHDINVFDVYRILARIAGVAAHREIVQLEARAS